MSLPAEQRNGTSRTFELPDDIDQRLIAELQGDARMRIAELGRRVGLSAPAVADRLRRLTDNGTLSFRAEVDPRAFGYQVCAIVRVSPWGRDLRAIAALAQETAQVTECYRITGEDCYFMKLHLRSIDELEPILDRFTPHGRTTTSIVQSSPVPTRPLPLGLIGSADPPGTAYGQATHLA
jgi:Lrp/AsnC family transcriptional regulator, leucine-responsive regulatory protein